MRKIVYILGALLAMLIGAVFLLTVSFAILFIITGVN